MSTKRCAACASEIQSEAKKCPLCHSRQPGAATYRRAREGRIVAGVCAGFAHELGLDPVWVRLGCVLLALISLGLVFWGYLALWLIAPAEGQDGSPLEKLARGLRELVSPRNGRATPIRDEAP